MLSRFSNLIGLVRSNYLNQILWALGLFLFLISCGIIGFMTLEGYNLIEALYMTVITISTVGFTEVKPLSQIGRLFTSFLIILSIGIFAYTVTIVTTFIIEGELRSIFKRFRVNKEIEKLRDHIIVCGYGRHGKKVSESLLKEGHPFVVIESDEHLLAHLRDANNTLFIEGDATEEDIILESGIEHARSLITTLPKDTDNLFVVLTARQFNKDLNIISRASEESSQKKLLRAGADHVIMPEHIGGIHMANLVTRPDLIEFLALISGQDGVNVFFGECVIDDLHEQFKGKTIKELDLRKRTGAHIIGMRMPDGQYIINPGADVRLPASSTLILLGTREQIQSFREYIAV